MLMADSSWLGMNSKQGKMQRVLADIQTKMRLTTTGDKLQIRQSYIPALHPRIVKPLVDVGAVSLHDCLCQALGI